MEILIATVLIGLLVAGGVYYANIGDKVDSVNMVSAQTAAVVRFPEAIMTIYSQSNDLSSVTKGDLLRTRSVINNKPIAWSVLSGGSDTPTKTEISIKFSFAEKRQADSFLSYLNSHTDTTMIKSAKSSDQGKSTSVRYAVSSV